jgi:hypothetical protein
MFHINGKKNLNMADWVDINGATEETFQPGELSYTKQYRRKVISTLGEDSVEGISNEVQISVVNNDNVIQYDISQDAVLLEVVIDEIIFPDCDPGAVGVAQTIHEGEQPAPLSTIIEPVGIISYQWEVSPSGSAYSWHMIMGGDTDSYQPPALNFSRWYRRWAFDGLGQKNFAPVLKITVLDINEQELLEGD